MKMKLNFHIGRTWDVAKKGTVVTIHEGSNSDEVDVLIEIEREKEKELWEDTIVPYLETGDRVMYIRKGSPFYGYNGYVVKVNMTAITHPITVLFRHQKVLIPVHPSEIRR